MPLAQLIECEQLATQLNNNNLIIFDCRFALDNPNYGQQAYQKAHIPNAIYLDLDKDLSSPVIKGKTSRHPLPNFQTLVERLAQCGLNNDCTVIIYDDGSTPFASKLWWTLIWLGKKDNIFLLNGGFTAWQKAGLPTTGEIPATKQGNFNGRPDNSLVITAKALEEQLNDNQLTLLDARALPRFRGEIEPLDTAAGHIPGASCADFSANLNAEGYFLPPEALKKRFEALINKKPIDKVIAYCGSGVSACHNLFALCLAGYPLMPLYAGSWSEWITDPKRPIATGD